MSKEDQEKAYKLGFDLGDHTQIATKLAIARFNQND
jgi:hypothetical protein